PGQLPSYPACRESVVSPTPGRPATRPRSPLAPAAVLIFPPAGGGLLLTVSRQPGLPGGRLAAVPLGSKTISLQISSVRPPGEASELRKPRLGRPGPGPL